MGKLGRTRLVERLWSARTSTKVLLFFIFASLIPLYGLVALTDHANSSILRAQQLENLTNRSVSLAAQIDDQLGSWSANSKQLAADPETVRFLAHDPAANGEDTVNALRRAQGSDTSFRAAFLVDGDGTVVASSDPALAGSKDFAGTQMFLQPKSGNAYISDLSIGKLAPVPAIYFASPVRDAVGAVVGVAGLRTAPDKLFSFFRSDLLGQERYAMLMDQYGIIIGTSGTSQALYHSLAPLNETQQQMLRQNQNFGSSPVSDLGMTDLSDRLQGNRGAGSTTGFFKPTNQQTVFGFAPLGTEPWQIVVAQPESAFLAPIDQSRNNTIGFTTVAAVIIIAVIFLVSRAFERTERQSLHDSLTGLPNRRYFHDILDRELIRSQRNSRPLSLINVDLDHFKAVNDEYGHSKGDEILKAFARVLKDQVRSIDLPVRYGGEEFLVLLPDTDKEGAVMVAEKIRRAADRLSIPRLGSMPGRKVTVSAGIATHPTDSQAGEELVRCSDQAMYLAKNLGRNQVIGYGMESSINVLARNPEKVHLLVQNANKATIEALAAAIDARDTYTHGHSHRVADYAHIIATELEEEEEIDTESLHLGALLHDVGKIGISDQLLRKPSKLTPQEFEVIKSHVQIGYEMVQGVEFLRNIGPIILHHHENFGGGGYPNGLKGKEIPVESRIIMVCDAFDAMTSTRTYRKAGPVEHALEELAKHEGRQFDPDVVDALRRAVRKGKLKLLSQPPPTAAQMEAAAAAQGGA
jgi:diguanylate cyclase (GGDEF)-like protein/putative nucleotidyltransferase with HDIG domain